MHSMAMSQTPPQPPSPSPPFPHRHGTFHYHYHHHYDNRYRYNDIIVELIILRSNKHLSISPSASHRDNVALLVVLDIPSQDHPVGSETCSDAGETSSGGHSDGKAPPSQESAKGETSEHPPVATTVSAAGGPVDGSVKGAGAVADECSAVTSDSPVERGDTGGELAASSAEGRGCARVVVANTHLLFNPKRGDVKTAQLMMLTRSVERWSEVAPPWRWAKTGGEGRREER